MSTNSFTTSKRRLLRFSLRTLLILVTVFCVWLGLYVISAERQKRSVQALQQIRGARIAYDYETAELSGPPVPAWLVKWLGLDYFANVTEVSLEFAKLTDVVLAHLCGLTRLEYLDLEGTEETNAALTHLCGLSRLRVLDLENTNVSDAGLEHLQGFSRLEELWLERTQVTDAGIKCLAGLTNLKRLKMLSLESTHITDVGIAHLRGFSSLEGLCLQGTQVTDGGVSALQRALPKARIYR